MALFKEIIFHDIDPSLRDFAIQPKTFDENQKILQKYYNNSGPMKPHAYLSFVFSSDDYLNKCLYSNVSQKYALLKKALNNKFSSNNPHDYLDSFSRAQKIYFAFSRIAFMYRYKKAIVRNEEDMLMLPISDTEKDVIVVYENNNKYLFRHSEILKICRTSLCHASENDLDYIEPKPMKNPYTNLPFNKASLFYMYDKITKSSHRIPLLFQTFFLCSFNLKELWIKHSPFIIDLTIKDYLKNAPIKTLTGMTFAMLEHIEEHSDIDFKFSISPEFDRKLLITIMKPYLELFLQSFHNHDYFYSNRCLEELKYKLKVLYTKHPHFGKKRRTLAQSKKLFNNPFNNNIKANTTLCTEHNNFTYSTSLDNFKESHSYTGFVDDVDFHINDPYFAFERREIIMREEYQNTNFGRRQNNNQRNNSQQNNRERPLSTDDFQSLLHRYQNLHRYQEEVQVATYNDEDDNNSNRTSERSDTTTTTISSIGEHSQQNDIRTRNNLDINDTREETDLFDDNETVDLSEPNNNSENVDENNEFEDGEMPTVEPPQYIQDLQDLSMQVKNLLKDDDTLVIDGRQRLLSLLSQIDNLHTV